MTIKKRIEKLMIMSKALSQDQLIEQYAEALKKAFTEPSEEHDEQLVQAWEAFKTKRRVRHKND